MERRGRRRRARRGTPVWPALALVVTAMAGCGSGADDNEATNDGDDVRGDTLVPEEVPAGDESFYDIPDPMPAGEHGDLVRYQLTGAQPHGLTRYRVMYLSETATGDPTVVTGLVAVPAGPPPDGGWPVLTYARGSSGIADDCAISRAIDGMGSPFSDLAAEAALVEPAVARDGLVAALTDYQGIGGPGIHPFVHGITEARSVLDIVRAARDLPDVEVSEDVGIMGYSQGGHAALWANQEAAGWTPELTVHGTVAGAPASELLSLAGPGGILTEPSMALLVAGQVQEDPDLDADEVLTPEGAELVERYSASCRPDGAELPTTESSYLTVRPHETEPWRSVLEDQIPGDVAGASPVLLVHGEADRNIPVDHSEALRQRLCGHDTPAERRVVAGADHVGAAVPTIDDGSTWLAGRIAGTQPPPTC